MKALLVKPSLTGFSIILFSFLLLLSMGCSSSPDKSDEGANITTQGLIEIDGSSTVYPITEAVSEEFQKKTGTRVTVGISGTGGGFKKFCRGETVISDASRPIKENEMSACSQSGIKYIELPIAFDGLTVVKNPDNKFLNCIDVHTLKKIWEPYSQGKITKWNQVNPEWPGEELKLFGPGTDSGTFDYFTDAVVGEEGASRGDFVASEDDNVLVQGVARNVYGLGYFGYAYFEENQDKIDAVAIKNPQTGDCVKPSLDTVKNGEYVPLSRPLFIYASKNGVEQQSEVRDFVNFYIENAPKLVKDVGYIPLPQIGYKLALEKFKNGKSGTAFSKGGSQVGMSIEELMKAEHAE